MGVEDGTAGPLRSPSARDLGDLFLRPRRFFGSVDLDRRAWYLSAVLLAGIASAIGRLDEGVTRSELGQARPGWSAFSASVLESWPRTWLFLLIAGPIAGAFIWLVGGWWYRVRLRWSGASQPDRRRARLVMISAGLVFAVPTVMVTVVHTLLYPSYLDGWYSQEAWSVVVIVFPFWSVMTSYAGASTCFEISKWKGRLWFFILPMLAYLIAFGLLVVLFAILFEPVAPALGERFALEFF